MRNTTPFRNCLRIVLVLGKELFLGVAVEQKLKLTPGVSKSPCLIFGSMGLREVVCSCLPIAKCDSLAVDAIDMIELEQHNATCEKITIVDLVLDQPT